MPIWQKKRKQQTPPPAFCVQSVQTGQVQNPFAGQLHSGMIDQNANRLFEQIRQAVPVVDAAIGKIIRLVGGFTVVCDDSPGAAGAGRVLRPGAGGAVRDRAAAVFVWVSGRFADLWQCGGRDGAAAERGRAWRAVQRAAGRPCGGARGKPAAAALFQLPGRGDAPAGAAPGADSVQRPELGGGADSRAVAAERPAVCLVDFAEHLSGDGAEL